MARVNTLPLMSKLPAVKVRALDTAFKVSAEASFIVLPVLLMVRLFRFCEPDVKFRLSMVPLPLITRFEVVEPVMVPVLFSERPPPIVSVKPLKFKAAVEPILSVVFDGMLTLVCSEGTVIEVLAIDTVAPVSELLVMAPVELIPMVPLPVAVKVPSVMVLPFKSKLPVLVSCSVGLKVVPLNVTLESNCTLAALLTNIDGNDSPPDLNMVWVPLVAVKVMGQLVMLQVPPLFTQFPRSLRPAEAEVAARVTVAPEPIVKFPSIACPLVPLVKVSVPAETVTLFG